MASKKSGMGPGPDVSSRSEQGRPSVGAVDVPGTFSGGLTRAQRNQAAFLGAMAGDCGCPDCCGRRDLSNVILGRTKEY
jgi:hypothetical protein